MAPTFEEVNQILDEAVETVTPAAQLTLRQGGVVVFEKAYGWLDAETKRQPVRLDTRFDLASVTKLFAVAAFMTLVEEGRVSLDDPVSRVLPEFSGLRPVRPYEDPLNPGGMVVVQDTAPEAAADAGSVTFRQLLSHTAGLPAWRPLYKQEGAAAARRAALETFFSYQPGTTVVYSDIGLILTGSAIEVLAGQPLDEVVYQRVTGPLGLTHTGYIRLSPGADPTSARPVQSQQNIAPTELCGWRGRRLSGEVHDENAWRLEGVSAHAGLFSTAADVARFGQAFLNGGEPILKPETVAEMRREQSVAGAVRRGLGFVLWSPDPEASGNPFSRSAFGHTGFTGTSVWIDPERELVVALLTNEVYGGREGRGIMALRVKVHHAIVQALEAS